MMILHAIAATALPGAVDAPPPPVDPPDPPFVPRPPGTLWFGLDAAYGVGDLADGDPVASWDDVSVHARSPAQSDEDITPVYKAVTPSLGGRPSVTFTSLDRIGIPDLTESSLGSSGYTVYAVGDLTDLVEATRFLDGNQTKFYASGTGGTFPHVYLNGWIPLGYAPDSRPEGAATPPGAHCWTWQTGLAPKAWIDRVLVGEGEAVAQMGINASPATIGPIVGDLTMLFVFRGIHTEEERAAVWDYITDECSVGAAYVPGVGSPVAYDTPILAGQSNALGTALLAGLSAPYNAPDSSVRMWNSSNPQYRSRAWEPLAPVYSSNAYGYGPEASLMRDLAADAGWPNPAIYKCARGSTSLAVDWAPGTGPMFRDGAGPMWREMVDVYARASAALPNAGDSLNVRVFVWIQSESDCILEAHSLAYGSNLTAFKTAVRTWLGKPNLPFWIVRLPVTLGAPFGTYVNNTIAGQNAAAAADPFCHIIDTPMPLQGDNIHFTAAGLVSIGQTLAASIIAEGA